MGFMITAAILTGVAAIAGIGTAYWLNHRNGPATWRRPEPHGRHLGERCPCGGGHLQLAWQHGRGAVLGCTRYPDCRVAFRVDGWALPDVRAGHDDLSVLHAR
jgi:hypothetical protein